MLSLLQARPLLSSLRIQTYLPRYLPIAAQLLTIQLDTNTANVTAHKRLSQVSRHFSTSPGRSVMDSKNNNNDAFKPENLFSVKGKIALITGGGSGIGLMATQALAVNGVKVYIVGRTEDKLERVVETYGQNIPGQIIPITADISSKSEISKLVDQISSKETHLDILINNAGIAINTQQTEAKNAEEFKKNMFDDENETFEMWTDTYRTNVPQIFFTTTAFLPLLAKATEHQHGWSGTVINISSISGIVKTAQHHFAYNASKAAAIHLTQMLSSEVSSNGIKVRINSIAPGVFPSEMTAKESGGDQKSSLEKEKYEDKTSARRPGKDEDMGNAILFAATNQYLQAQTVTVDGGYVIQAGAGPA